MSRQLSLLLLVAILAASCGDSHQERKYVQEAVEIMDSEGLFAEGIYWEKAKAEALATDPETFAEAHVVVKKALKTAGGKHSGLITKTQRSDQLSQGLTAPTVTLTADRIAVIRLPAFSGNAENGIAYARTVIDALPEQPAGAIINLQGNTGGNMYPMIAAVHRFLPDDVILTFVGRNHTSSVTVQGVLKYVGLNAETPFHCPVAVVTDNKTTSAAEAVTLWFRGLDYSRSFGGSTAGLTSANSSHEFSDGSVMVLTVAREVTRTGEVFCDKPVAPNVKSSYPIDDALKWIRSQIANH